MSVSASCYCPAPDTSSPFTFDERVTSSCPSLLSGEPIFSYFFVGDIFLGLTACGLLALTTVCTLSLASISSSPGVPDKLVDQTMTQESAPPVEKKSPCGLKVQAVVAPSWPYSV